MNTLSLKSVKEVLARYPLQVNHIRLLSNKGKKAVWSIQTDRGEVIMKKVPLDASRIRFMVHAIDYLKSNGVRTPGVLRTSAGDSNASLGGEHFVVFESVSGRSPNYDIASELLMIMRGMAAFHRASIGIESPTGTYPSFLLLEWKQEFQKRLERLTLWKQQRMVATDKNEFDKKFLEHVDAFLLQGRSSLALLDQPYFDRWVEETKARKTLCHQDFAAANLTIGSDGKLYVYDMDSLTVDLPVRDIRKILNKVMKKGTDWDLQKMLRMMEAYQEVNPLTKEQYRVLAADIQFPHLFYGQVSKYYEKRENEWTLDKHMKRLKEMIATESSKNTVLESFLARLDEVVKT